MYNPNKNCGWPPVKYRDVSYQNNENNTYVTPLGANTIGSEITIRV